MRKSELSSASEPSGNADKKLSKLVPIQRDGELRGHQVVLVVARKKIPSWQLSNTHNYPAAQSVKALSLHVGAWKTLTKGG
jgi:hypothetical protein